MVKWFEVLLFHSSDSICQVFLCHKNNLHTAVLFHITNNNNNCYNNYPSKSLNISIWHIDGSLTGTIYSGQSGLGSNVNEGVLYIFQSPGTGASPLDAVLCLKLDPPLGCVCLPCRGGVVIIYNLSQPDATSVGQSVSSRSLLSFDETDNTNSYVE